MVKIPVVGTGLGIVVNVGVVDAAVEVVAGIVFVVEVVVVVVVDWRAGGRESCINKLARQ